MRFLIAGLLSLLAANSNALNTTGGGCTTDCTFTSVTTNGTAPSLTATGGVFTGSVTVAGPYNASVGGSLGIGTASPATKLHVASGPLTLDGSGGGRIYGDAATYPRLELLNASGAALYLNASNVISVENGQIRYITSAGPTITQNAVGLGIGTASPASKLDVVGDAQFGSGVNKATVTAGGFWQPLAQTTLQASLLAPTVASGQYIQNSTINELCKSTGTGAGNWQKVDGGGGCF